MWYTIKEGKHRASPLSLGIHTGKVEQRYEVIFDESCRYEPTNWENDYNKLGGWSYGYHMNSSVRIGWRYNTFQEMIEVVLYLHADGKLIQPETLQSTFVPLNTKLEFHLIMFTADCIPCLGIYNADHSFGYRTMYDMNDYNKGLLPSYIPKWGYNLGLFFGGNSSSPKSMKVWIKKLKKS